jgi:hypothetical protein
MPYLTGLEQGTFGLVSWRSSLGSCPSEAESDSFQESGQEVRRTLEGQMPFVENLLRNQVLEKHQDELHKIVLVNGLSSEAKLMLIKDAMGCSTSPGHSRAFVENL